MKYNVLISKLKNLSSNIYEQLANVSLRIVIIINGRKLDSKEDELSKSEIKIC